MADSDHEPEVAPMSNWTYDLVLWIISIVVDLFFREIHPRSSWKIPRSGPVIFVAAPHANQFVDPLILMRVVRLDAKRRISFLIAEKSMKRRFIGASARACGAVPVGRALDSQKATKGTIYCPDPANDPTLLRGIDTDFTGKNFQVGGMVVLPTVEKQTATAEITEIISPTELRVKKPISSPIAVKQLTGRDAVEDGQLSPNSSSKEVEIDGDFHGTPFKIAPKVDQSHVYNSVFDRLIGGGCVGIFPEGGSHDRTELLPLKAGVAIMALGALAKNPKIGLKIVPVGMNYFHAHKFRSRAVIEFGNPIEVDPKLVDMYKSGERREAVGTLLDTVYDALVSVTVTSPDYDTLMLIQAGRRLYNPKHKKLPLPMVVEMNRRLVKGYARYKDDPRLVNLKKNVLAYNKQLMMLNIRDHQVEYARLSTPKIIATLFYRVLKLIVLTGAVLPGLILFAPIFIIGKYISVKKSREALAASTVKIQGRDVIATWKLLVAMALAPGLYNFYNGLLAYWHHRNRINGFAPEWLPYQLIFLTGYIVFPAITLSALRFGEVSMDISKSLRPLVLCLQPSSGNTLVKLRQRREALAAEVTELINTLGPEMFPDFENTRIIADPFRDTPPSSPPKTPSSETYRDFFSGQRRHSLHRDAEAGEVTANGRGSISGLLPRNESLKNLSNIGLFATPYSHTPGVRTPSDSSHHSRSSSSAGLGGGVELKKMSTLDSKEGFEEVSKKIRGAMAERGRRRRLSENADSGVEDLSDREDEEDHGDTAWGSGVEVRAR